MSVKIVFLLFFLSSILFAEPKTPGPAGEKGGERKGPPPEALKACASSASGAVCGFTTPDGKQIMGTCWAPMKNLPLACKPQGMEGDQGRDMPTPNKR